MAATLTLTDLRGDPFVGVRAALSGGVPDRVYQLYARRPMAAGVGTPTGAEVSADGTGAGAVDVPLADADGGLGVWGLFAVGPASAGPFWGAASAAGDDSYNRFIDGCKIAILDLDLPEIGEKVYDFMAEDAGVTATFPCVQLCLVGLPNFGLAETYLGSTSGTDSWGQPVRVTLADRQQPNFPGQRRRYLNWRGKIRDALIQLRPPGASETWKTEIQPQFVALTSHVEGLYLTSVMVARGVAKLVRNNRG